MTFVRGHYRRTRSGYTYVRPSVRRSSSASDALGTILFIAIGFVVAVVAAVIRFVVQHWIAIVATLLAGGALVGGVLLVGELRRRRVAVYLELARQVVHGADSLYSDLLKLARRIPMDDQLRVVG